MSEVLLFLAAVTVATIGLGTAMHFSYPAGQKMEESKERRYLRALKRISGE